VEAAQSPENNKIIPNFNVKDSEGQTVLGLALWGGLYDAAGRLLGAGANINEKNMEGLSLLHQAIEKQDISGSLFLIEHQADLTLKYRASFYLYKIYVCLENYLNIFLYLNKI